MYRKVMLFICGGLLVALVFLLTASFAYAQAPQTVDNYQLKFIIGGSFYADNLSSGTDAGTWSFSVGRKFSDRLISYVSYDRAEGEKGLFEAVEGELQVFVKPLKITPKPSGDFNPYFLIGVGGTLETETEITNSYGVGLWWTPPILEFQNLHVTAEVTAQNFDNGRKLVTVWAGITGSIDQLIIFK